MSSVGQWALKLASNDTKARGKAFKSLERWINARSEREDGGKYDHLDNGPHTFEWYDSIY